MRCNSSRNTASNQTEDSESQTASIVRTNSTAISTSSTRLERRKTLPSSHSSGPVCVDWNPADDHGAERTVNVKDVDGHDHSEEEQKTERRRKRDVVRQISMRLYLKGKDIAEDVLRNVALQRMEDAENVCNGKDSSLEHEISASKKTRKHLWMPTTQDDSVLLQGSLSKGW